jgi:hypothetical protein
MHSGRVALLVGFGTLQLADFILLALLLLLLLLLLLQGFDSQGLAKLAFGLAAVGYDDDALYTAITQAATQQLDSMSPTDVSMILWACGEQGHLCDKFMSGKGHVGSTHVCCVVKTNCLLFLGIQLAALVCIGCSYTAWAGAVHLYLPSVSFLPYSASTPMLQLLQTSTCSPRNLGDFTPQQLQIALTICFLFAVLCLKTCVLQLLPTSTCPPTWQTSRLSSCRSQSRPGTSWASPTPASLLLLCGSARCCHT